jgi:hypothetical protein
MAQQGSGPCASTNQNICNNNCDPERLLEADGEVAAETGN